jgi:hypothetical protein
MSAQHRTNTNVVRIFTPAFGKGFTIGLRGGVGPDDDLRFRLELPVDERSIVEVVRNLTELAVEGNLTESLLLHDCGMLTGYIFASQQPVSQ